MNLITKKSVQMIKLIKISLFLYLVSQLSACSISQITVRAAMPLIEGGVDSMKMENDIHLAYLSIPANISLIEGMLVKDPNNESLGIYAAEAYYGYAFGFVEDGFLSPADHVRASKLYQRCLKHAEHVLINRGLNDTINNIRLSDLQAAIEQFDQQEVPALFWAASCLAKFVDLNRDEARNIAQLPKSAILMQRILELDEHYYMSGAHIFFGVYYGSKSPMLGGNYELSEQHFEIAAKANHNKLLIVNLLRAQYLERQRFEQQKFHELLTHIRQASERLYPEQALINQIAKHKASLLLKKEEQWF